MLKRGLMREFYLLECFRCSSCLEMSFVYWQSWWYFSRFCLELAFFPPEKWVIKWSNCQVKATQQGLSPSDRWASAGPEPEAKVSRRRQRRDLGLWGQIPHTSSLHNRHFYIQSLSMRIVQDCRAVVSQPRFPWIDCIPKPHYWQTLPFDAKYRVLHKHSVL